MATLLCEWRPISWLCMLPFPHEGLWPSLDWASWLGHLCCPKVCICARGRCLSLAMASLCLELWGCLPTWLGATAWPFRVEFLCLPAPSTGLAPQCCLGNALGIKGRTPPRVEDLLCARAVPDTLYVLSISFTRPRNPRREKSLFPFCWEEADSAGLCLRPTCDN